MLGEKNPLSVVKGLGVGVSAVGKVNNIKIDSDKLHTYGLGLNE